MNRQRLLLVAGVFVAGAALAGERPTMVRGTRSLGMGDAFTAVADDQNAFFYNPSGVVQRTGSLVTLIDVPLRVSQDFVEFYEFIQDNEDALSNFDKLTPPEQADLGQKIADEMVPLRPTFGVGLPNVSYLSGPLGRLHWGFGLFGQADGSVGFNPDTILAASPSLYYDVNVDVVPMGNLAYKWTDLWFLKGKWGAGGNVKVIRRAQVEDDEVLTIALDDYESPEAQIGTGLGADLGLHYRPQSERWAFGLTCMDVGGTTLDFDAVDAKAGFDARPARTGVIKPRWNFGLAWTPGHYGLPSFGIPTGNRLLLAFDVKDFANPDSKVFFEDGSFLADTAGTHLYLGAEYRWWFFRFRGGANQGYPAFGLGLDWPVIKLDYAYFSDEASRFAGGLKHTSHALQMSLRFGTGNTEARERVGKKSETPAPEAAVPPSTAPAEASSPPAETTAPAAEPAAPEATPAP